MRTLQSVIAILVACAVAGLPSCASMGGGGMRNMLSEPASVAARDVSI
jgi:hypothetical protein